MNKTILLSFDVEEFEVPEEYGEKINEKEKILVSKKGLELIKNLLKKLNIKATFFVTANFALNCKKEIKEISEEGHEIGCHGYFHKSGNIGDIKKAKKEIEKIIKKKIYCIRIPRLKKINFKKLKEMGFLCDSSLNPTLLPGRYNNLKYPRTIYKKELIEIPSSTLPLLRIPLFWLSFKNFPLFFMKILSKLTLNYDKYLNIFFHPWEFSNIKDYNIPFYIKRNSGQNMLKKLEKYLLFLKKQGEFKTFSEFLKEKNYFNLQM